MKSIISQDFSRRWLGVGMSLVAALAAQASTQVTFMVDMVNEGTTPTSVNVTGSFSEAGPWWEFNSLNLINTSGTIWSNTFTLNDPVGTIEQCKFNDNVTGWEPSANRQFLLGVTGDVSVPGTQVLPLAIWNSASTWPTPTNNVTFRVNMDAQVLLGNFVPGTGTITVSGDFEGWNNGLPLTNNPTLSGSASNIYSAVCPVVGYLPVGTINYKFRMNGGWESPASTGGNNRQANITANPQVLPLVYYNDTVPSDLLSSPVTVKFSVYVAPGSVDINGYAFNLSPGNDTLWINGDFLNNWSGGWPGPLSTFPGAQQMIADASQPNVYTNYLVVPAGNSYNLVYKYSIDSTDDENGFATNHVRVIRSTGPTFNMPQDVWSLNVINTTVNSAPYPNPGLSSTNIVEPDYGFLAAGAQSGNHIPLTWLGRPAVLLQKSSDLSSWTDITATDGLMATNWPNGGGSQFFRLKKK